MSFRRVFLVSSGRLVAYEWRNGRFDEPYVFSTDEEGLTNFSLYLDRDSDEPVYLLVDFVEEEFREDTIPHVVGGDRRALVRTKLNRLFRDATYATASFQGREQGGRRDDRMLFTALIRPDLLAPWVGQISKHKVPLAGVYSLPLVSEGLLKPLAIDAEHALVVTLQSAGGLRQTFFMNGKLRLSRLAIMPTVDARGHASYVLGEIEKIRRYLNSLRMLPHDNPLDVYVIAEQPLLDDISRQSPDSITTRHHLLGLPGVAKSTGLKGDYASNYADRIYAHLLARASPANHYAPATQTRYFAMYRTRRWLKVASVALVVVSLGISGYKFVEGVVSAREAQSIKHQTAFYTERYRLARERLPPAPADSQEVKLAVEMVETMQAYKTTPMPMLAAISRGLDAYGEVQLDRISWETTATPDIEGQEKSEDPATTLYQRAQVWAYIDPFDGDYRAALDLVSQFAETLRRIPGMADVQVVSLPLDIGSDSSLQGNAASEASTARAPFQLQLTLEDRGGPGGRS